MDLKNCSINERVRYIRKQYLGLSQEAFGNKLGVAQTKISFIERNGNTIKNETISLICSVLHISEDWLRYGKGNIQQNITCEQELAQLVARIVSDGDRPAKKDALLLAARIINNDTFYNVIIEYLDTLKKIDP